MASDATLGPSLKTCFQHKQLPRHRIVQTHYLEVYVSVNFRLVEIHGCYGTGATPRIFLVYF